MASGNANPQGRALIEGHSRGEETVHQRTRRGKRRRGWRCPCQKIQGLLGSVYGQLAALSLTLFGLLTALVALPASSPSRAALLVTLGVALALSLFATWLLTRPLRALSRSMAEVRQGGYRRPPAPSPAPVSAEVFGIERACREMIERFWRDGGEGSALARMQATLLHVSREIHPPLTALQARLDELSRRQGSLAPHAREAVLNAAVQNIDQVMHLAAGTEVLARLHSPGMETHPQAFALDALAKGIVQRFRPQAARFGVDLEVRAEPDLPMVNADHDLIAEGLTRLLEHCLRHCPAGTRVRILLQNAPEGVRTQVRQVEADLASEGLYAPPPAPPSKGSDGATGEALEVAIARRVAELHGGELAVTLAPGLPTSYGFTLRRAPNLNEGPFGP